MQSKDLKPKISDYIRLAWAVVKLFLREPQLIISCLPRSWRGGYRSPWEDEGKAG